MATITKSQPTLSRRVKKKRTFNGKVFRSKRAYSFVEIAELLDTHIRTVQRWRNEGLPILDDGTKPFLVMGWDIQDFLKARVVKRRKPLLSGEFYCPKCQLPRRSLIENIRLDFTQRRLGASHRQVIIRGICEVCGVRLSLFSSEQKAAEWCNNEPSLSERRSALNGNECSSTGADIVRKDQYD